MLLFSKFVQVDCKDEPKICQNHAVSDQPVAKFYNHGRVELIRYGLTLQHRNLYDDVKNLATSQTTLIKTADDLKKFLQTDRICVLGKFTVL